MQCIYHFRQSVFQSSIKFSEVAFIPKASLMNGSSSKEVIVIHK